ncbi:MAG: cytochrome c1 [Methylotenera sp.]|nr:cytochrome c1 [Methylotenera sp.]MDO9204915.1 cytochrome c1 [Methylotenera sp.]MDO9393538.1 cytochrome c1 [Methylotenera sp.]MDP1523812.1 cytochrome c1 [Methylotenera sp.]MDP2070180.1 cytochrome c1 [Methylotenera sp.]MDP2231981.1 cytochrome c1 [Methylotenera sp.]
MKKAVFALLLLPTLSFASTEVHLDKAPIDVSNHASLQRGARTFINNCLNCHSANYMRYNRLQDIGLTEKQIKENLLFTAEKVGDPMTATINKNDAKKWFGVAPPDLSVEVRARGADWVYTYMRSFYRDDTRPSGWNNLVFDKVAMPHVLYELQGEQALDHQTHKLTLVKPGKMSTDEYDAMVGDLTNFMAYMSEPAKQQRNRMGWFVLLFLGVLLVLTYKLKKAYWKDIH